MEVKAKGGTKFLMVCDNCTDFDRENSTCLIRYTILKDKSRTPMKRKPLERACQVFAFDHRGK